MPASPTDLLPLEAAVIRDFTDQTKGLAIASDGSIKSMGRLDPRTSEREATAKGRAFEVHAVQDVVTGKYSAVQIYNKANSGYYVQVVIVTAFVGSTTKLYPISDSSPLSTVLSSAYVDCHLHGFSGSVPFEVRGEGLTTKTVTNHVGTTVTSTTSNGQGLFVSGRQKTLPPGSGFRLECDTTNVKLSAIFIVNIVPESEYVV